jgi:hypothetical protein
MHRYNINTPRVGVAMGHYGRVDARSMVFEVGDRVTGWGRLVADAEGEWLDLARVDSLVWSARPRPRSHRAVRLIGARFGPNSTATVTGVWLGDAIQVQDQSPDGPAAPVHVEWTTPPCPAPDGGWPRGKPDDNLVFDLGELQTDGTAVSVVIFRPSAEQAVLVVAADDVEAVRTVLVPQLPGRVCVVPSRWSRAQLDQVRVHLDEHWADWYLDVWGERADEHGQLAIEVELLRVTNALADWADTLPDGLLTLVPSLTVAELRA